MSSEGYSAASGGYYWGVRSTFPYGAMARQAVDQVRNGGAAGYAGCRIPTYMPMALSSRLAPDREAVTTVWAASFKIRS